jgi:hypothetical protein
VLGAGDDIPITYLLWHPLVKQHTLFIASANGVINCTALYDDFGELVSCTPPIARARYQLPVAPFQHCCSCRWTCVMLDDQRYGH